jgi:ABC-type uncharacterized transport system auxiliary subunit
MSHRTRSAFLFGCALLAALAAGCASPAVLSVAYRLPPRPAERLSRVVTVEVADERPSKAFLSPSAATELEGFTNVYALAVSPYGGSGDLKGAYEVGPLFRELMRYRLENAGVTVAAAGAKADAQVKFVLREFRLDYGDRKWAVVTGYDALVLREGGLVARQAVNGSAERLRIMGKTDAEKVIGELVSDALNRLDVAALFKQAGL